MEELSIDDRFELDSLRGRPEGPVEYVDALGMEVPTYIDPRKDMWGKGVQGVLMYHVPLKFRGPYKVRAGVEVGPHGERIGEGNYCMCCGVNKSDSGSRAVGSTVRGAKCANKAINYSGYCGRHGGALHPMDKSDPTLTREAAFKAGKLPVSEMDEEELARGQIRRADGTWTQYRSIPTAIFQEAQRELFQRADIKLRENLVKTVDVVAEIAAGTAYEPEVRLRAATWIFERVRGKNPDIVVHTQDKPFEMLMHDVVMVGGSRAESRARRGIEDAIDAEVVPDDGMVSGYYADNHERGDAGSAVGSDQATEDIELTPLTAEVPVHYGPAQAPIRTPPVDPLLRDKWEKEKYRAEVEVQETVAEATARLSKMRADARAKRYAARNKGLDHVESWGYGVKNEETWIPDPKDPQYEIPANYVHFIEPELPKVPPTVKAADTRRIKRTR